MHFFKSYLLLPFVLLFNSLTAQNYQALHGSSYAGSLGVGNNPASIVHVPYAWDITPFSVQLKQSTNAFIIEKYSLLSSPGSALISSQPGIKKRFVLANQDIRLLNTRISLNARAAVAFGANIRNYLYATTTDNNWQDTLFTLGDFMKINTGNLPLAGESSAAGWGELYMSYAQTMVDNGQQLLNAGLTLKVTRGLAGAYAIAQDLNYRSSAPANVPGFILTTGSVQYGYSFNFDSIDSTKTAAANRRIFFDKTYSSLAADLGVEYILRTNEDEEEGGDYAYKTKIGLSVMDIGSSKFRYGIQSRVAIAGRTGITDTLIEDKFSGITSFDGLNDSLATITGSLTGLNGEFFIFQPTRLMINVDQHIIHNFFVNAELTVPVLQLFGKKNLLFIRDMNLLAITPRWELKSLGAYFPILFNNRQQLWVGGAFKAGPLLLGTHNLANLFSKNKSQVGGLYLAVTIRPGKIYERDAHYPADRLPAKKRRNLECPKF